MYILAIETTGPYGSVALINENKTILAHEDSRESMSHLKDLMPMIRKMMGKSRRRRRWMKRRMETRAIRRVRGT